MLEAKKWPGTEAETKFSQYLVASAGAHFVTVVRRGVGELLGIRVPGQTFIVRELMEAATPPAPSVAVKALEWEAHGEGWRGCGSIIYEVYPVAEGEGWWAALSMAGYLPFRERCKSPEEAKAAAQSDYEARIRSALSAQVQDVAGWQREHEALGELIRLLDAEPSIGDAEMSDALEKARCIWDHSRAPVAAAPAKQEG